MLSERSVLLGDANRSKPGDPLSVSGDIQRAYRQRLGFLGGRNAPQILADAGAAGIISSSWSGGWGVNKVFSAPTRDVPSVDLSCEDYGMVFRMAEKGQGPRIRMEIEAEGPPPDGEGKDDTVRHIEADPRKGKAP